MPLSSSSGQVPAPRVLRLGGESHLLRPLRREDASRLIQFFESHNEETVRARYGYFFRVMTRKRAEELVGIDQTRDLALGILSGAEYEQIDAVGRYFLLPDTRAAEMAFVVRESKRRLGMARTLLHEMTAVAKSRGLVRLIAQVQRQNHPMLDLFRSEGASCNSVLGMDAVDVVLPLERHPPLGSARTH